jgi:predicted RNA binding protein YcfA (HicA-like mRNA interferase family)
MSHDKIPAITGEQLIRLLVKDGWVECGHKNHGVGLTKKVGGISLLTIVPNKSTPIPEGTLSEILGPKQTRLGKEVLAKLIAKYWKKHGKFRAT